MNPSVEYFAGFFDGEGCIVVNVNQQGYAYVMCEVVQRDRRPLDLMANMFEHGGKVREIKNGRYFGIRFNGANAEELLRRLLPYLVVKREQAELALQFKTATSEDRQVIDLELRRLKRN